VEEKEEIEYRVRVGVKLPAMFLKFLEFEFGEVMRLKHVVL
jgi:hypothetical protein